MEKQKLWKLKRLEATDEMLELAGKDIPIITNVPYEKMEYPTGLYVRTELEDNILKVGIFFAEILASGGRRPSYALFINPKKECFTSYDYRLKKWTDNYSGFSKRSELEAYMVCVRLPGENLESNRQQI